MIKKYNSFFEEMLFEKMINESIVYYSPNLMNILQKMSDKGNEIAKELIKYQGQDSKQDMTFIDIDKQDGYLSFITMKNAVKLIEPIYPSLVKGSDSFIVKYEQSIADALWRAEFGNSSDKPTGIYSKSRNKIKIGRIVNKLLPGKFNDKQIEEFVNLFKATIENSEKKFLIVEGDEIAEWYKEEKYKEMKGTLGNSCMKSMPANVFDIYTKNPEVCKLLILIEDDKLIGRALVWKINTIRLSKSKRSVELLFEYFLDRQYTINDSDVDRFRDYANKQGWGYKTHNNYFSFNNVTFKGTEYYLDMTVQLKECKRGGYDYGKYPYLDTFRRYDPYNGVLYNDDNKDGNEGHYILDSTTGGYEEIITTVWSDWEGENIPEDEAVWSDNLETYLRVDNSVQVIRGSREYRGWWPIDHDDIVYDKWLGEYLHKYDCDFSDYHGRYIFMDYSVSAVRYIRSDGYINSESYYIHINDIGESDSKPAISISDIEDMIWYKMLSDPYKHFGDSSWDNHYAIMKRTLVKNFEDKWIPEDFSMKAYKSIEKDEYYSIVDAYALGIKIDTEKYIVIDKFEYEDKIKEKLPIIKNNLLDIGNNLKIKTSSKQNKLQSRDNEEYINKFKIDLDNVIKRLSEIDGEYYI